MAIIMLSLINRGITTNMDQVFVQHRFTITQDGQTYSDALVVPLEKYQELSPEDIEQMKQDRFNNWVVEVNTPPADPIDPIQDLNVQIDNIDSEITNLSQLKQSLTDQVTILSTDPVSVDPVIIDPGVIKEG